MREILSVFLFVLFTNTLLVAQEFSLSGLILSAYNDPLVQNIYDQTDFLRSANMRTPNINDVELRGRSDDLDLSIDDVRLRLTFTNFGEIREGERYNNLLIENYELEYQARIHVALIHRYKLAIDYIRNQVESGLTIKKKLNIEDQIKVEKANVLIGTGDIEKVAELDRDYTKLLIKESQLQSSKTILESRILGNYPFEESIELPQDSLISPAEILDLVNGNLDATHPELKLKEQDMKLGLQETRLEIKESNGDFGFLQAEYERDPNADIGTKLGYQLGFTIPITNEDKADNERNKLRNLKEQQSLDYMMSEHGQQMTIVEKELTELVGQFTRIEEHHINLVERNKTLENRYLQVKSRLTIKENELQFEEALIDQKMEIYSTYLKWLDISGAISYQPLKNYLLQTTPQIQN